MQRLILIIGLLALLAGCGGAQGGASEQTQTVDGLAITLIGQPEPATGKPQKWTVKLADSSGQPVKGADVYLDLIMTSMTMGQNKPLATDNGDGTYTAEGVYSMGGAWQVVVHAEVDGADRVATFEVSVAD
ncbi:MAG TPA: FixH family protein [Herpetosiphonaceae bacterium]|nr:FixH family protein [Herpetosiphonaceae bacterium]